MSLGNTSASKNLISLAKDLIQFYVSKSNSEDSAWEISFEDKPVLNFLKEFSEEYASLPFHEWPALYILQIYLDNLDTDNIDVREFAITLINALKQGLNENAEWHWIIIPLRGARLANDIEFENFRFISGDEDQKIEKLADMNAISIEEADRRAKHLKIKGSSGFFLSPLLAIKVKQQTEVVEKVSRSYAFGATAILQTLNWSRQHLPKEMMFQKALNNYPSVNHLIIYATDITRHINRVLMYNSKLTYIDVDNLLSTESARSNFSKLFEELVAEKNDALAARFALGMRHFIKGITLEKSGEFYDGISLSLLHLVIAAETMFLDKDHEKRSRLTVLLPKFSNLAGTESHLQAQAIARAYEVRSEYVHAGKITYSYSSNDWDKPNRSGHSETDYILLKRMLASFIECTPAYLDEMRLVQDDKTLTTRWLQKMREVWNTTLGLTSHE